MTLTPPTVTPVTVDVPETVFRGNQDVQPFTYRSGMTYTQLLESMRVWLRNTLVPYLNTNFSDLTDSWLTNVTAIDTAVNTALAAQADAINTALTAQQEQVAAELAQTLSEITSGENAALNDAALLNALQVAGSTSLAYLDGRYLKTADADSRYQPKPAGTISVPLAGTGIDLTGAADSTAAVQTFFDALTDGATVVVPSSAVIKLSATINLTKRVRLTGSGELRWTAGIANSPMLNSTKDGSQFDGLYLTNPNHLAAATGNRTAGIYVQANHVRITGCRIVGQQQAIMIEATGEFHDFTITGNLIEDVPGSGDGVNNGSAAGEDRGDGIVVFGATATIVGNRVDALTGTDARIGIALEQLAASESAPYLHGDAHCVVAENIVTGKFRRSISSEGVAFAVITGNTLADFTWYGINIVGTAHHNIVAGNAINLSRASTDNQGSAWSPVRCGIMVYDGVQNVRIADNTVVVTGTGGGAAGIAFQVGTGGMSLDAVVESNHIDGGVSNLLQNGVAVTNGGATRVHVRSNIIKGFTGSGITLQNCPALEVVGNHIIGSTQGSGVTTAGSASQADGRVDRNTIEAVTSAIQLLYRTGLVSVSGNQIKSCTNGVDLSGWAAAIVVMFALNNFYNVTAHSANLPSGANTTVTNVGNN